MVIKGNPRDLLLMVCSRSLVSRFPTPALNLSLEAQRNDCPVPLLSSCFVKHRGVYLWDAGTDWVTSFGLENRIPVGTTLLQPCVGPSGEAEGEECLHPVSGPQCHDPGGLTTLPAARGTVRWQTLWPSAGRGLQAPAGKHLSCWQGLRVLGLPLPGSVSSSARWDGLETRQDKPSLCGMRD